MAQSHLHAGVSHHTFLEAQWLPLSFPLFFWFYFHLMLVIVQFSFENPEDPRIEEHGR